MLPCIPSRINSYWGMIQIPASCVKVRNTLQIGIWGTKHFQFQIKLGYKGLYVTLQACVGAASTFIRGWVLGYTLAYRPIVIGRKFPDLTTDFSHVKTLKIFGKNWFCMKGQMACSDPRKYIALILGNILCSPT